MYSISFENIVIDARRHWESEWNRRPECRPTHLTAGEKPECNPELSSIRENNGTKNAVAAFYTHWEATNVSSGVGDIQPLPLHKGTDHTMGLPKSVLVIYRAPVLGQKAPSPS